MPALSPEEQQRIEDEHILAEKFNRMAGEAVKSFPEQLSRLTVVFGKTLAYISPALAGELAEKNYRDLFRNNTAKHISGDIDHIARKLVNQPEVVGFSRKNDEVGDISPVNVIALKANPAQTSQEREMVWTFDHEIGHQVVKNAYDKKFSDNLTESAADAYATLMHIQRYGKDAGFIIEDQINAASLFLMLEPVPEAHYTALSIQCAQETAAKMEDAFFKLKPPEIAALAAKIADENIPEEGAFKKMWEVFQPMQALLKAALASGEMSPEKFCQEVFAIMDKHRDEPVILKAAALYVNSDESLKELVEEINPGWEAKYGLNTPTSPQAKPATQAAALRL